MIKNFIKQYFFTRKELSIYLTIAFPMIISQATDTLMFFTDRIFLSHYKENQGEIYLNASLASGITSYFLCAIFILTISYINTLSAQYYGAKKYTHCAKVGIQSFYFAILSYPILLLMILFTPFIYRLFEHNPLQTSLQITYTRIILIGSIIAIIRNGISSFFIGIGKTNIVMISNIFGLLINIPFNYILINGIGIFPELGIAGAAIATVLSSTASLIFQLLVYFGKKINSIFHTRSQLKYDNTLLTKLIRFGFPQGVEVLFGVGAFNYFILVMNNFGPIVGAAVTIAINWDSMFFIPMIGAQFATTSLVGRYMGAKDIYAAKRVMRTSLSITVSYAIFIIICFLSFTHIFINPFITTMKNPTIIYSLSSTMLKTACIYLLADAVYLTFSGVLRGAGDTKAVMYIFIITTTIFSILINVVIQRKLISPMGAWFIFIGFAISLGIGMIIRYLQGKWKTIDLISDT